MKNIITSVLLFILCGNVLIAQTKDSSHISEPAKIIVLVNTASWCPVCKNNGPRVKEQVISKFKQNIDYQIVVNDLSSEETKLASRDKCEKAGILSIADKHIDTGKIYFINAANKSVVSDISVIENNDMIVKAFNEALLKN
jgi:hypothetical protein